MSNLHVVTKNSTRHRLGGWEKNNRHQCDHSGFAQELILTINGELFHHVVDDIYRSDYLDHAHNAVNIVYVHLKTEIIDGKFVKVWSKLIPDTSVNTSSHWYKTDINQYVIDSDIRGLVTMKIINI